MPATTIRFAATIQLLKGPTMTHKACFWSRVEPIALILALGLLVMVLVGPAHAQSGCEYVQTGQSAGDFFLDCTSHLPPGKMPDPIPDRYLAIAMSPNMAAGIASGPSKADTERSAMAQCKAKRGDACRVVKSYLNMCAAIALSNPRKIIAIEEMPGQGWNPSELARRKCEISGGSHCSTIVAGCANGYMSPTPWLPPTRGDGSFQMPTFRQR
jgi:hypothetical protein